MQEVGGSSPPVPTSLRQALASLAASAGKPAGTAGARGFGWQASERSVKADGTPSIYMSDITITLPDGSERHVPRGTSISAFAAQSLPAGIVRKAIPATVGDRIVDLTFVLGEESAIRILM